MHLGCVVIAEILVFLYLDTRHTAPRAMQAPHASNLFFYMWSVLSYMMSWEQHYNIKFCVYLLYDTVKMIVLGERHLREYLFHHTYATWMILFRNPRGPFLEMLQLSELSTLVLNLSYMTSGLPKRMLENVFSVLFMYVRMYSFTRTFLEMAYQNLQTNPYFWHVLPMDHWIRTHHIAMPRDAFYAMDVFVLLPLFVLHLHWTRKIVRRYISFRTQST